ncbi:MAG: aminotransferase class I/II-fold pyridoxal phosphate-dependent enzyme, partial [Clostridia bacterium]|nr:aminotransferase class I/II-fold pyridoxal phosphate-dependent enzyme [Clostridia bacterium]
IVYLRDKSVQTILSACRNHGVTHIYCVPMLYNALAMAIHHDFCAMTGMSDEQFAAFCDDSIRKRSEAAAAGKEAPLQPQLQMLQTSLLGTQIRSLISGGGHVPEETLRILNAAGYDLYNGFGMTECGIIGVETSRLASRRIKGSIGKPMDVIEYRFDPEGAEEGELLIRGEILYTASMKDGKIIPRDKKEWFRTGDIARSDGEGLYIAGRCKDVIVNASGENIYPDILEDAFAAIPGTARICILGIRNGQYEDVSLLVEPAEGFDEAVLVTAVDRINAGLAPYNRVSRILVSAKPIPVSASLKVRRQPLKKAVEEGTWEYREVQSAPSNRTKSAETIPDAYREEEFVRVRDKIRRIMAEELYLDEEEIDYDAHFTTELGGDSLTLYSAVCAIEKEFGIIILDSEIRTLFTVNDTARFILAKLHGEKTILRQEDKTGETSRITDFAKSSEYLELQKRKEETMRDGVNPYFVPHDSLIRDTSIIDGQKVINLGSYNYLGMSGDPETMQAAIDAVKMYGTSASGSRTLAGEKTLYQQLERCIADWKHTEDCIVCTGGWATNLSFISCFMRKGDFILYDKLSHNSIEDGVRLSEADSKAFGHNDFEMLEKTLKAIQGRYNKVLIIVEGVYSMDGDIAPIPEFVRLKEQYGCFLMVDEAHSGGVIGDNGGGVDDYFHLKPHDVDIKMGTLSKALGTCGGFIAADHSIVEYLRYSMDGFVFTAGIAPPLAAACMKAIEIIRRDNTAVTKLHRNIEYFTRLAREAGMDIGLAGKTAIVPVLIGSDAEAARISNMLMKRGVFAPPAMYPAVPMGKSRIRFTVSSTHSEEQLDKAIRELSDIMRSEGLLK